MENGIREAAARRRERANRVREEAERDRAEFEADERIRQAADTLRQYGPGTCCYSDALWPEWDYLSGDPIPDVYWQKKAELLHAVVLAIRQSAQHSQRLASLEPSGDEDRDLAVALYRTAEHGDVRQTAAALRELQADENGVFLPAESDGSSPNEPVNRWLACGLPDEIRDIPHAGSRAAMGSEQPPASLMAISVADPKPKRHRRTDKEVELAAFAAVSYLWKHTTANEKQCAEFVGIPQSTLSQNKFWREWKGKILNCKSVGGREKLKGEFDRRTGEWVASVSDS